MKIFVFLLPILTTSYATPISPEKRSIAISDPANLLDQKPTAGATLVTSATNSTSEKLPKNLTIPKNQKEEPSVYSAERPEGLTSDDLKVRVLDLNEQSKNEDSKPTQIKIGNGLNSDDLKVKILDKNYRAPQVQIGLPLQISETHIIGVPESSFGVPYYIPIKEPHLTNRDYYGEVTIPGSLYPFGEFPSLIQGFPSSENLFDFSGVFPSHPVDTVQGFEGFLPISPISGVGEIQGFPGFGDNFQGVEALKPQLIPVVGITNEKDDHDDTVTVEASELLKNVKKNHFKRR